MLEAVALHSRPLQRMLLRTHERALRKLLPLTGEVHTVKIVGGGMFPRTAILLRRLLPEAEITIVDANESNIQTARGFLERRPQTCPKPRFVHEVFEPRMADHADLLVIPLAFMGNRRAIYACPPARTVLVHDWIWSKQPDSAIVSPWLLKRINLVRR
jgi:hypothetical protein